MCSADRKRTPLLSVIGALSVALFTVLLLLNVWHAHAQFSGICRDIPSTELEWLVKDLVTFYKLDTFGSFDVLLIGTNVNATRVHMYNPSYVDLYRIDNDRFRLNWGTDPGNPATIVAAGSGVVNRVCIVPRGSPPPPEPATSRCENKDQELENGSLWLNIGSPEFMTSTVKLEHLDGIYQLVDLQPGPYAVKIVALTDPNHNQTMPITVTLGNTSVYLRTFVGVDVAKFTISTSGTYTLSVVSGFDHPEDVLELDYVCLKAEACVNKDPELMHDKFWTKIEAPEFLTPGVRLGYQSGLAQSIFLPSGAYQLKTVLSDVVSGTMVWLGADMAGSTIKADPSPTVTWEFLVSNSGTYMINAKNPSFTNITITYLCLYPVEKQLCTFSDHKLDLGSAWNKVGDVRIQDGMAVLGCDSYIEQIAYLNKGSYVISVTADVDFLVSGTGFNPYNEGGDLNVFWEGEHFSGETVIPIPGGLYDGMNVYTSTVTIPFSGYYRFRFWNGNCYNRNILLWYEKKVGTISIDEICIRQDIAQIGIGIGDCRLVRDSSMSGWGWKSDGSVSWSGTAAVLGSGSRISQLISISSTDTFTQLVAYVVARAGADSQLRVSLIDNYTFTFSQDQSEFSVLTATLSYSNISSYVLSAVGGNVEIDFTCLYRVGEMPDGPWYPGADGDPVCVRPRDFDFGSLTWDVIESVSRIIKLIWEWIVFLWCEVTHWLARIWFRLSKWATEFVVDLGDWLTDLRVEVMNWPVVVLAFDILLFLPWLLNRLWSLLMKLLFPFRWASSFTIALLSQLFSQISNPNTVEPLTLGEFGRGFAFVRDIANSTPISVLIVLINAALYFIFIVWSIRQFSESNT